MTTSEKVAHLKGVPFCHNIVPKVHSLPPLVPWKPVYHRIENVARVVFSKKCANTFKYSPVYYPE